MLEMEKDYLAAPTPFSFGVVSLQQVVNNKSRLDASAYNIEVMKALNKIKANQYGYITLYGKKGLIDTADYPGRYKRIYVSEKHGTPFFLPSQLDEILPRPTKFVSPITVKELGNDFIKDSNLLLSRSGTIGKSTISSSTIIGKLFSDDVIRVTFKNEYDLGYVYTYLKSPLGLTILQGNIYGSVIDHIEPEHLNDIPIPNAPQKEKERIHNLIKESFDLRDKSNKLIDTAQKDLYRELGLSDISSLSPVQYNKNAGFNNFSVKLSKTDLRLDGSYHIPIVKEIIKKISEKADYITSLGDDNISESIILPGRFKRVYVDKEHGIPFFGGKQLLSLSPSNLKYLSKLFHGERIKDELFLKENMCAVSCSGTIGKVMIIPKHWEGWAMNQHVIRIVPKSRDVAGYIYAWVDSQYCKPLIDRYIYGSNVDEIDDNQISKVPIPIIKDKQLFKEINNKILSANKLRYDAYLKEQEALEIMDTIIEYTA